MVDFSTLQSYTFVTTQLTLYVCYALRLIRALKLLTCQLCGRYCGLCGELKVRHGAMKSCSAVELQWNVRLQCSLVWRRTATLQL